MAGLLLGRTRLRAADKLACATNHFTSSALRFARGQTVGKFFLFIVAVSIAILLAMSVYIISL